MTHASAAPAFQSGSINGVAVKTIRTEKWLAKLTSWMSGKTTLLTPDALSSAEEPLRSDIFTADQMAQHGKRLAALHELTMARGPDRLLPRLDSNEAVLVEVCAQLASDVEPVRRVTPAGEWLLDNYYLIEEEIRTARLHLPLGYSRELPRLANGPSAGLPRVYDLALEVVSHGDGRLTRGTLMRFIAEYQSVKSLRLGELWAIPIMLRLALIENLRRVGARIAIALGQRSLAGTWADQMFDMAEKNPTGLILIVADMARSNPPMTGAFVAELARRLQGHSAALSLPLTWIEQHLAGSHQNIEQVVHAHSRAQAAAQVSVSNSIGSLRLLDAIDWREFVETLSQVEQTLRKDPAEVYARMDFATRDNYRHAIERVAKLSPLSEPEIAAAALELAAAQQQHLLDHPGKDARTAHIGHYLIGKGVAQLELATQARLPFAQAWRRAAQRRPLLLYGGSIVLLTLLLSMAAILWAAPDFGTLRQALGWTLLTGVAICIAASQLALSLVNWAATALCKPKQLPRLDFSAGIAADCRTLVVVPTLLGSEQGVERLLEALEVHSAASRDANLRFGLLTDFHDAAQQTVPADDKLVRLAREGVAALNLKHRSGSQNQHGDRFFLFHRPRRWNECEQCWMGYERKRGKLADLNALLRGRAGAGPGERFSNIEGQLASLEGVRYVITLDTDTMLPRDAAWQLVATMAHPLNRPVLGGAPETPIVIDGYGILQPRVSVSLTGTNRSRYAQLTGDESGIDPYTRAVSDVYQDLLGQGSFVGKGIYDVDAFDHVLGDRLPENRILSHDLLEGCYARSGFLSDVQLFEEAPSRFDADVSRRHRWIRGDWQIIHWLMPTLILPECAARNVVRTRVKNPLSTLSRWKIFDNLRRSLVPAALTLLFVLGWFLPAPAWPWTLAGLSVLFTPPLISLVSQLLRKPKELRHAQHLSDSAPTVLRQFGQALLYLATLPFEAIYSLDAALRAVSRLLLTRRRLLEWKASHELADSGDAKPYLDLLATVRKMWFAPTLALVCAGALALRQPATLGIALLPLLLWLVSPVAVWLLSQPLQRHRFELSDEQTSFLRMLARRTWAFFDTYVGADDHHLPPDNMQEHPVARVAHRTSPTNIGMSLLANLTAYDLGYLTLGQLLTRTRATFDTLDGLERHQGHFLNWYDTQTLKALHPRYVSSVDSGNLAGHLLTLRAGLLELATLVPQPGTLLTGMQDTLRLLQPRMNKAAGSEAVRGFATLLAQALTAQHASSEVLRPVFEALAACSADIVAALVVQAPIDIDLLDIDETQRWALALDAQCRAAMDELGASASERKGELAALAQRAGAFAQMDYSLVYDPVRKLMVIGYNVDERRSDTGYYDLLASEIRLASFVAIAQGKAPQESWFALGRLLTTVNGEAALMSWSGSMFEYLMPMLVMPSFEGTLLDQTMHACVDRQISYGRQRGVPWGVSESGYNTTDAHLNYQYRAFGVPDLGLKRGLADDLVVAPYATVLALMVEPRAAIQNLHRLVDDGLLGAYGYYEAIDYTRSRLPRGQKSGSVVRSFMAHHQGMSLMALGAVLLDQPMQRRFQLDTDFRATLLLLQERIPKAVAFHPRASERAELHTTISVPEATVRLITTPYTPTPEVQLLSNGRYHVMLSNAGGGYSRWNELALTRWREDATCDGWGSFCYLRDLETGTFWSTTHQPTQWRSDLFEAIFTEGRAEFRRRDQGLDTHTEIVVSPEDDIELRRLRITNLSNVSRNIEVTSYTEVVLAPAAADNQHPAFSKLFVQTEAVTGIPALLCTRRPRALLEPVAWMLHLMAVHGAQASTASHETDRARFIGRGRSLAAPQALLEPGPLSGTVGSVLDPVLATRRTITLEPGQIATIDMVYGVADSRDAAIALIAKHADRRLADRVFELAWTHSLVLLRQINASEADTQLYAQLAGMIIYAQATMRADVSVLLSNRRTQSGLWGYAISGDLPIVLVQVCESANIDLVRQMVRAHAWWRLKGLAVDLVIWNEERDIYRQRLQEQIIGLISAGIEAHVVDRPGGIFVRHADHISAEDSTLLRAVARAIITDRHGSLAEQLRRRPVVQRRVPPLVATRVAEPEQPGVTRKTPRIAQGLQFFNGTGGFSANGLEYVITPRRTAHPPAPWVNVIANPRFGSVISEGGSAYTWCENAHELRLTPWHNDPVCDTGGETFYLRDEETGKVWHPTSLPSVGNMPDDHSAAPYLTRHGFGYSVFEHDEQGVHSELTVYVAIDAAIKFSVLKLRNDGDRPRRLSATGYVEWVLGDERQKMAQHVTTQVAPGTGALYARNHYSNDFGNWVAFFDIDAADRVLGSVTCDRAEFIGRNGSLRWPAALARQRLSGRTGAGFDPCAAIQVPFDLDVGASREIVFRLGMGRSTDEADQLVARFRGSDAAQEALAAVQGHWQQTLGAVQVRTPDPAINLLVNGWLLYQTLSCRMWARSGYYQSGGAYGFRDQLQDAMALVHTRPALLREQLLLGASRQFIEGDVQHWWHPPSGRGVRTHISDDYLWLPLALCRYVQATHDVGALDELVPFLDGRPLDPSQESYYDLPARSVESRSLYQHAVLALLHGLRFGAHGLPLMGGGDWNDGMNAVGHEGKGESVWLGFFLCEVLRQFAPVARAHGDAEIAQRCEDERSALGARIEAQGWDGGWYRRAYFDDGTPLGSKDNIECQIDSIAQSWAVLSGIASPQRARLGMDAMAARLVRPQDGLVQLLDPPFDRKGPNPGYISGYVPGVRENGGQYTHSAIWATMAFAALGDAPRAWELMNIINPVHHGRTVDEVNRYKIEPYVVAADVYSVAPHTGRGGWSWYTGSAGWMYRLVLESLLGLRLDATEQGAGLQLDPCVPPDWTEYEVNYRYRDTPYTVHIATGDGEGARLMLDGVASEGNRVPLVDDGQPHRIELRLAASKVKT